MEEINYLKQGRKTINAIVIFNVGILLSLLGLFFLLFREPKIYYNYRYQLEVRNGSLEFLLGLGFVIGGIIKYRKRKEIEKRKREKRKNWLKHY